MSIIDAQGLRRVFRRRGRADVVAVDDLTFAMGTGDAVGYIGANGAGKSTTIKMLTGILAPTAGRVRTCGLDPMRARKDLARRIGVVFGQRSQLWWDLPTQESFTILAAIHRLSATDRARRTAQLVDRLELGEFLDRPVRQLSLGQRMRAELAAALLHSPELLILDEPTVGLDVLSKQRLREFLIEERAERGTSLLLTTHDMGDISRLCDRVLVVDTGRLVYDGTLAALSTQMRARRTLVVDLARPWPDLVVAGAQHLSSEGDGLRQRLAFDPVHVSAAQVLQGVSDQVDVVDLAIEEPEIEDVVAALYGR